jgi:hypothetical protein
MKNLFAFWSLFALLLLPASMANAACSCSSCCPKPSCCQTSCQPACSCGCDPCTECSVQCVTLPKRHFWNLKRTGYYVVCPCMTGCAAPVCPTKIGECISSCVPSKLVVIPKRHFWEKDRYQRMPISNTCCDPCCKPSCGCCD